MTAKYKKMRNLFFILSVASMVGPLLYYGIRGFATGSTVEKFALSMFTTVALIVVFMNIALKIHLRSAIWLMILGIYICLDNITALLIVMAICTLSDEIVFTPLYKRFKTLYVINKEIDKRNVK